MFSKLALLASLPLSQAAETVLGVYMLHRHGDRSPKALAPANLTYLGYQEVFYAGEYFRNRYVSSGATNKISGMNTDVVKQTQIAASAPADTVLQNSAAAFLQGLYPPVGSTTAAGSEKLRNGTTIDSPMNGFQLIPISVISTGGGSEDNGWLQDASNCNNAKISSNNYFNSADYAATYKGSVDFYTSITPVVDGVFPNSSINFKNAYTIWDLINVAEIHNSSIPDDQVLTAANLKHMQDLAFAHEWGLAYNASDNMRAMVGMQLAAEVVAGLNSTITSSGKTKFQVQFGAYATMLSFFGLAQLDKASNDFTGIPDYASALTFELFTTAAASPFPKADDLQVRFLFNNRTASANNAPTAYPLFGGSATSVSWNDFVTNMNKFAVGTTQEWCTACGNTTGTCAAYAPATSSGSSSNSSSSSGSSSHHGMSAAVGGVIGAMVTLAVLLGLAALVMLIGGMRLVGKKSLQRAHSPAASSEVSKAM